MLNIYKCVVINIVEGYGEAFGGIYVVINQTLLKLQAYKVLVMYKNNTSIKDNENVFTFSTKRLIKISRNKNTKKIIHIHGLWYLNSFIATIIANYQKVPIIFSPHGMLESNSLIKRKFAKKIWLVLIGFYILKSSKYILVTTQGEFENSSDLKKFNKKIIKIPLGGDHWIK